MTPIIYSRWGTKKNVKRVISDDELGKLWHQMLERCGKVVNWGKVNWLGRPVGGINSEIQLRPYWNWEAKIGLLSFLIILKPRGKGTKGTFPWQLI